ncbi:porin [Vibrio sp. SCSIO 43136]|uniref:porin n=1 Tax=Vibrio sp. SCSIO 43136 TaxID=2819101 RepID=UPI0020763DC6|nr:porin [Vibrio sp. SCSIO 43136]USD65596.1 porin [Vibrio sp. SCSIO 43136]
MKKTLLAAAVIALTSQAHAIEVLNQDGTTFSLGGHVSVSLGDDDKDNATVKQNSPRLNFNATHEVNEELTVDAKGEWALNYINGGDTSFTTRLGYIGLTHDSLGRVVVGTQWSPYYTEVGLAADKPIAFANDYIYNFSTAGGDRSHGDLGTGRANKMVSYRNSVELGEAGTVSLGAGWQGAQTNANNTTYGQRAQVAVKYVIQDIALGYAYNTGKRDAKQETLQLGSASYGTYSKGLYAAVTYQNHAQEDGDKVYVSQEALVAYGFENNLTISANFEEQKDDTAKELKYKTAALQSEYKFTSQFVGFAGYQFNLGDKARDGKDNKWNLGVRYYL